MSDHQGSIRKFMNDWIKFLMPSKTEQVIRNAIAELLMKYVETLTPVKTDNWVQIVAYTTNDGQDFMDIDIVVKLIKHLRDNVKIFQSDEVAWRYIVANFAQQSIPKSLEGRIECSVKFDFNQVDYNKEK